MMAAGAFEVPLVALRVITFRASKIADPGAELGIFTIPNETLFVSLSPPQVLGRIREKDYVRGFFRKLRSHLCLTPAHLTSFRVGTKLIWQWSQSVIFVRSKFTQYVSWSSMFDASVSPIFFCGGQVL